jgi:transketolase
MLPGNDIQELEQMALEIRKDMLEMINVAGAGHAGGCLSAAEIITVLYFSVMNIRPDEPKWSERDRFILSKGHAALIYYAVLAERGFFPKEWLSTFNQSGTNLQCHIDMKLVPGSEASTGSLGQGLSMALGMAISGLMDNKNWKVYVLISDGEAQEGQIWEAALAAAHHKVDNLIVFLDYNRLQVDGSVDEINSLDPIEDKWRAFNWHVQRIDGHSIPEILTAIRETDNIKGSPHMIIADTIKGKGVSFMENNWKWHARRLKHEEYELAKEELGS